MLFRFPLLPVCSLLFHVLEYKVWARDCILQSGFVFWFFFIIIFNCFPVLFFQAKRKKNELAFAYVINLFGEVQWN